METGKTTLLKVVESALSGSVQHISRLNECQQFPREDLKRETVSHDTLNFSLHRYCTVVQLTCLSQVLQCLWTGLHSSCIEQQTCCRPSPYTCPGMYQEFNTWQSHPDICPWRDRKMEINDKSPFLGKTLTSFTRIKEVRNQLFFVPNTDSHEGMIETKNNAKMC